MALIEKEFIPPKKEQFHVRLDPDLIEMLNRYAAFIESSSNYIIEQSLRHTFTKDRDFQTWLSTQETTGEDGEEAARG